MNAELQTLQILTVHVSLHSQLGKQDKLTQMHDGVKPIGVLDNLRISLGGVSLNIQAYAGILSTLGAGGYQDEALGMAGETGNPESSPPLISIQFCCYLTITWNSHEIQSSRITYSSGCWRMHVKQ